MRPSIQVCSQCEKGESGLPSQIEKSASFPATSEPTRSSTRSCFAGFRVTNLIASSGGAPPYLIAFAASVLSLRASSSLSEL